MVRIWADLHIHIGQSLDGHPVKITAARNMTLPQVLKVAEKIKGLTLIGVIDAHSRGVREDFRALLKDKTLRSCPGGGYQTETMTVIPGTEIEIRLGSGSAHFLAYFPTLKKLEGYIDSIGSKVRNWQLGSQKAHLTVEEWLRAVAVGEGIWFPAHVFTPHKGIYGNCCGRLLEVLPTMPKAIEIGLSADRRMASMLSELEGLVLFSNSDAHSLGKIGREYNHLELRENSFTGLQALLSGNEGEVLANYGLPPQYGKYYRSYCPDCGQILQGLPPEQMCYCGNREIIPGVLDRLLGICDRPAAPETEIPYIYQVPLQELPGIGPKLYGRLLECFGTEMAVLHEVDEGDLVPIAGEPIARLILQSRRGELEFMPGGGGIFGKVKTTKP